LIFLVGNKPTVEKNTRCVSIPPFSPYIKLNDGPGTTNHDGDRSGPNTFVETDHFYVKKHSTNTQKNQVQAEITET